jgi:hypothetical protein
MIKLLIVCAVFAGVSSCEHSTTGQKATTSQMIATPLPIRNIHSQSLTNEQIVDLCSRLKEIQIVPPKGDRGMDPTFDSFMEAGDKILPCLIDQVVGIDHVGPPNPISPGYAGIQETNGDVAFFVLLYLKDVTADQFLPEGLQDDYKEEGVYTYYKYVRNQENRKKIQAVLRQRFQ